MEDKRRSEIEDNLNLKLELEIEKEEMQKDRELALQKKKKFEREVKGKTEDIKNDIDEFDEEQTFYSIDELEDEFRKLNDETEFMDEDLDEEDEIDYVFENMIDTDEEHENDHDDADKESVVSEKVVENLMKEIDYDETIYDDETIDEEVYKEKIENFVEDDYIKGLFTKNGQKENMHDDSLLMYNDEEQINFDDTVEHSIDDMARAELLMKVDEEKDEPHVKKVSKFQKYYSRGVGVVILFFLILIFLLVIYINNFTSDPGTVANNDSPSTIYTDDDINNIINQNRSLQDEVSELRNEMSKKTAESSADVVEPEQNLVANVEPPTEQPAQNIEDEVVPLGQPDLQQEPQPTAPPAPKEETITKYTVKENDTLYKISKRYYGNIQGYQKIMEANDLKDDSIVIGQEIIIP